MPAISAICCSNACALFQDNPDVLADYQRRFKYMLVDEYQDTNVAQYLWLRLLAQGQQNICCVGDDDQSIYGWRGAEVDNILRFEKDFPGARSDPAGAELPFHAAYTWRCLRAHRQEREPARQDAADRARRGRAHHPARSLGWRRGSARHRRRHRAIPAHAAKASTTSQSWCAPRSRCGLSRTGSSRSACLTG